MLKEYGLNYKQVSFSQKERVRIPENKIVLEIKMIIL